jgi:hypothetical protein
LLIGAKIKRKDQDEQADRFTCRLLIAGCLDDQRPRVPFFTFSSSSLHPEQPLHFDTGVLKKLTIRMSDTIVAVQMMIPTMIYCKIISGNY